jgi:hypothetical protein
MQGIESSILHHRDLEPLLHQLLHLFALNLSLVKRLRCEGHFQLAVSCRNPGIVHARQALRQNGAD